MKRSRLLWAALALAATGLSAQADDHGRRNVPLAPAYVQECGACHIAYPPGLLGAASWQRLMNGLSSHYGTDASLDTSTRNALAAWLNASAGSGRRVDSAPPEDRITRGAWFLREHRGIAPAVWQRPAVRGASNCQACHQDAAAGRYDEHAVNIPR